LLNDVSNIGITFKPLIPTVTGFALSNAEKFFTVVILYYVYLLAATFITKSYSNRILEASGRNLFVHVFSDSTRTLQSGEHASVTDR
jgi:hypothetical protein